MGSRRCCVHATAKKNEGIEQDKASAHDAKKQLHIANGNLNHYATLCSTTKSSHDTSMLLVNPNAPKFQRTQTAYRQCLDHDAPPSCTAQKRGIEKHGHAYVPFCALSTQDASSSQESCSTLLLRRKNMQSRRNLQITDCKQS